MYRSFVGAVYNLNNTLISIIIKQTHMHSICELIHKTIVEGNIHWSKKERSKTKMNKPCTANENI